jgi:hypothetical protein
MEQQIEVRTDWDAVASPMSFSDAAEAGPSARTTTRI